MAKIIKNNTSGELVVLGQVINASGSYTIRPEEELKYVGAIDPLIDSGTIIVNDGTNDLSASAAKSFLSGVSASSLFGLLVSANSIGDKKFLVYDTNTNSLKFNYPIIDSYIASSTTSASTTSTTYVPLDSMSYTPPQAKYLVTFTATGSSAHGGYIAIFVNGTIVPSTDRLINFSNDQKNSGMRLSMSSQAVLTVDGSQEISVQFKSEKGSFTIYSRSLVFQLIEKT